VEAWRPTEKGLSPARERERWRGPRRDQRLLSAGGRREPHYGLGRYQPVVTDLSVADREDGLHEVDQERAPGVGGELDVRAAAAGRGHWARRCNQSASTK